MGSLIQFLVCCALALGSATAAGPFRDIDGRAVAPFRPSQTANVLLFVTSDCPISNGYAPDLQQLCAEYKKRGVNCSLIYEDAAIEAAAVRKHLADYRYGGMAAAIDDRASASRAQAERHGDAAGGCRSTQQDRCGIAGGSTTVRRVSASSAASSRCAT